MFGDCLWGMGGLEFMETSKNNGIITAFSTSGNEEERERQ